MSRGREPLFALALVATLLAGWLALLAVESAVFLDRAGRAPDGTHPLRMAAKEALGLALRPLYDRRLLATTPLPVYDLELTPRRFAEWHAMLARVRERGHATAAERIYLPARFRHGAREYDVDLRPRGTLADHYKAAKPSLRVRFPPERLFRGQRVMNLIIPYDQARVVGDTTLMAVARERGFLTLPRRYAVVRLNGRVLGVYQEVEHFRVELGVRQGRSEGFFVSAAGGGKGGAETAEHPGLRQGLAAVLACAEEDCSPAAVATLLDRWLDVEKFVFYAALTTWAGAWHAWGPDNLILFFDPGRGRFEPVPWDMGFAHVTWYEHDRYESAVELGARLLADDGFRHRRDLALWTLIRRQTDFALAEAERQFAELEPSLAYDLEYSRRRTRRLYRHFRDAIETNSRLLRDWLEDADLEILRHPDGLAIANRATSAVDLAAITGAGGWRVAVDKRVPGRYRNASGTLFVPLETAPPELALVARNAVTGAVLDPAAVTWSETTEPAMAPPAGPPQAVARPAQARPAQARPAQAPPAGPPQAVVQPAQAPPAGPPQAVARPAGPPPVQAPPAGPAPVGFRPTGAVQARAEAVNVPEIPGLAVREEDGETVWSFSGRTRLARTLVVPEGVAVRFEPGLELLLDPDVDLVIRGRLTSAGTVERPVRVAAADPARPFGTLAVVGRPERPVSAVLRHTTIERGSEGALWGLLFSGMLAVHDGALEMRACRITDAAGEDAVNVKYGSAVIEDTLFARSAVDALDLDFTTAVLIGNRVDDAGGDGFDFSGTLATVTGNVFAGCGDKALSIGERSAVDARDNRALDAATGVAVKDRSTATLDRNRVTATLPFAVYRKKPVFGSGVASLGPEEAAQPISLDPEALVHGR